MFNYHKLEADQLDFIEVASEDDLPENERLFLDVDGLQIVVFRMAGQVFAIGDVCSHDGGTLGDGDLDVYEIGCPRHGARFDIRDGKVKSLPAVVDIPAYPVRITNRHIEVGIPKDIQG